jgi:hypothetical protein
LSCCRDSRRLDVEVMGVCGECHPSVVSVVTLPN